VLLLAFVALSIVPGGTLIMLPGGAYQYRCLEEEHFLLVWGLLFR